MRKAWEILEVIRFQPSCSLYIEYSRRISWVANSGGHHQRASVNRMAPRIVFIRFVTFYEFRQ